MDCANCGTTNSEGASFCSNCGTALKATCPNCGEPTTPGASFCSNCGTRLAEEAAPTADPFARYLPAELQAKLEAARSGRTMAGERRTITMLFADVQGSTAAAEQLDPEEWAEVVNGAFERLIRPVYRYEGTLARLMGDAILAFFGAPIAHEDDPERAVMAGLEMLKAAKPYAREVEARWGVDFDLRVGINTGLVVVGEVGSDLRVEYTALGDAVNVAARMEQTAAPGTLQISDATHRLVDQLFEFERLDPIEAKGKAEPVEAYRVLGARRRPPAVRGILGQDTPIVGRDSELSILREVIAGVRQGKGQICSVIGEAGVGKSKLAAALRDDLSAERCLAPWLTDAPDPTQVRWAEARCLSYNSSVPYAPFIDLFGTLFDIAPDDDAAAARSKIETAVEAVLAESQPQASFLAALLGIEVSEDQAAIISGLEPPLLQKKIFSSVIDYIEACSVSSPSVLVIEDLHWADPVSLALLEELMRATDRSMLAIVVLMRPYREDAAWGFHETAARSFSHRYRSVRLDPLDESHARDMVGDLLGEGSLPDTLLEMISDRAEGNPFFVEEILRELMETGALTHGDDGWTFTGDPDRIRIPGGVTGLLTARLDRLEEPSRLVLQLASVLGREFEFSELGELAGSAEDTDTALTDLMRRDLLVEQSRIPTRIYAFRHALIQETAYDTILLKTRRALHAEVAERLIDADAEPHEIAHHLIESRQEHRAVPYLAEAGDWASRAMSLADAIRYYDRALNWVDESDDLDMMKRIYEGLGAAYTLIPDLSEASASYQQLLELGRARSAPSVQISALNRLGFTAAALGGDYDQATEHLEEARRLAEEHDDGVGLAEYHMNSCLIATTRGDMEKAAAHDAETTRLGAEVGSDAIMVGGLLQRVLSLIYATRFDDAISTLEKLKETTAGITNPSLTTMVATAEQFFLARDGDLRGAWEVARSAAEEASRVGSSSTGNITLTAGHCAKLLGDYENALALYAQTKRLGEEIGQFFNASAAAASMVRIYAELGITDDETEVLRQAAIDWLTTPLGGTFTSTVWSELGRAALQENRLDEAADLFATGIAGTSASKMLETPALLFGLAAVRTAQGEIDAARPLIDEASTFVAERQMAWYRPFEALARGRLLVAESRHDEAVEVLQEGSVDAESMGMMSHAWRLRAALSEALAGAGRPTESDDTLSAAESLIEAQASRIVDDTMRASFMRTAHAELDRSRDVLAASRDA